MEEPDLAPLAVSDDYRLRDVRHIHLANSGLTFPTMSWRKVPPSYFYQPHLPRYSARELHMFEQEIEMEQKEGRAIGPVIMIVAMVGLLVGGIGYMVYQNTRSLKAEDAASVITASMKLQPPSEIKFHAGKLQASMADSIDKPHYKLLADAGLIKIEKDKKTNAGKIDLTDDGEKTITSIPEFQKKDEGDGSLAYTVPLATRKFVKIDNITKLAANRFQVEYSWQWEPNKVGDAFDISGKYIQKFSTWDRSQLIDKYGANYYHGDPTKVTVLIVKGENGWTLAKE